MSNNGNFTNPFAFLIAGAAVATMANQVKRDLELAARNQMLAAHGLTPQDITRMEALMMSGMSRDQAFDTMMRLKI